ncbi:hypothetical protein B9Z19DRAFT_415425 [Tuber borchii]|uniref:Uncharacterized protein n=1 Tax=Tuber borchii TaxID=42251 RepID=A0A2T7A409_TUBBO|nr:hypothetical protein B9Z19DRAFT_415425 [Tuber borchii]
MCIFFLFLLASLSNLAPCIIHSSLSSLSTFLFLFLTALQFFSYKWSISFFLYCPLFLYSTRQRGRFLLIAFS